MQTLPLSSLRPGHEINIDSRTSGRDDNIDDLANSIAEVGLLAPLGVWKHPEDGVFYVAFGNRRLRALQLLAENARIDADAPVQVTEYQGELSDLLELSIIENVKRESLHPIDRYVAFATLLRQGANITEIAKHYGVEKDAVLRSMALGRLHPEIIAEWRKGNLDDAGARHLTVLSQDEQLAVFRQVGGERGHAPAWQLQRAIKGDAMETAKYLGYIGTDAYLAAGGRMLPDLFEETPVVLDHGVVVELARAKLEAEAEIVRAEGWAWVVTEFNDPPGWYAFKPVGVPDYTPEEKARLKELGGGAEYGEEFSNRWQEETAIRDAARVRGIGPKQRATSGVRLKLTHTGKVDADIGYREPEKAAKPTKEADRKAIVTTEPQSVIDELRVTLTEGLQFEAQRYFDPAMRLFLATMLAPAAGSPIKIRAERPTAYVLPDDKKLRSFEDAFAYVDGLEPDELCRIFATIVGGAADVTTPVRRSYDQPSAAEAYAKGVHVMAKALDPEALLATLRAKFNAEAYFTKAPGAFALTAIAQCVGAEKASLWTKKKKGEVAAEAAKVAREHGWLPGELRTEGYAHPFNPLTAEPEAITPPKAEEPTKAKGRKKAGAK